MIEVLLTAGEYSDYSLLGLYRVESKEWLEAQFAEFKAVVGPKEDSPPWYDVNEFRNWIKERGAIQIPQSEMHLKGYAVSRAEFEWNDVTYWKDVEDE